MEEVIGDVYPGIGAAAGYSGEPGVDNPNGTWISSAITSPSGQTGTMYVVCPEGWYDHSLPDFLPGYISFSESEDSLDSGAVSATLRSSWLIGDYGANLIDRDGNPVSYTLDHEWMGVEERDGFGYSEFVAMIGDDCYVNVLFEGATTMDNLVPMVLSSFYVVWD
jgi:hypothetical protein